MTLSTSVHWRRVLWITTCWYMFCTGGCVPHPVTTPDVPTTETHTLIVPVYADGHALTTAYGTLRPDSSVVIPCRNTDGLIICLLTTETGGAELEIRADGYQSQQFRLTLPLDNVTMPGVSLRRLLNPLPRIRAAGRAFMTSDGQPWIWQGATAFRLLEFIATGREAEADAYLAWAATHDVTIVRVLTTAWYLFRLSPAAGLAAVPRLLELADQHRVYVELVALADTRAQVVNYEAHVSAIGAACAAAPACAVIELANEIVPVHPTQDSKLGDVTYLQQLRALIPPEVLVSLGSTHGGDDESDALKNGDVLTIHGDRTDGDDGWRFVRHTNEQRVLSEAVGKPAVNDEPARGDLSADKHLALAVLCRLFGLGDTFHYGGGLQGQIPQGEELAAFEGRRQGWLAIPPAFTGRYANAGFVGAPVAHFTLAVRAYSSLRVGDGYTLVFGIQPGGPILDWSADWPTRDLRLQLGGTQLWQVWR